MNTSVSVPGAFTPVKKKSSFFSKLNLLRLVRAVIPAAVLMMF
ncbi:TPA: type IV conjugative transfer system pilin TraA, partial [Escherichia coli]